MQKKKQKKEKISVEEEHAHGWDAVVCPLEQELVVLEDNDEEEVKPPLRQKKNFSVRASGLIGVDQLFEESYLAELVDSTTKPRFGPSSLETMTLSSIIVTTSSATPVNVLFFSSTILSKKKRIDPVVAFH